MITSKMLRGFPRRRRSAFLKSQTIVSLALPNASQNYPGSALSATFAFWISTTVGSCLDWLWRSLGRSSWWKDSHAAYWTCRPTPGPSCRPRRYRESPRQLELFADPWLLGIEQLPQASTQLPSPIRCCWKFPLFYRQKRQWISQWD